ncbi:MAG: 50S ribosomal protein L35 [Candidatus Omnitrophica bacterium]|nr:50S ribosomal protein L35 [Candidatus Omnitrophota bacterium]
MAKRFSLTKKGRLKHPFAGKSHLLTKKKAKRIRKLRRKQVLRNKKYIRYLKKMLPYR